MNKFKLDLAFLYQPPLVRDYDMVDNDTELQDWMFRYDKERAAFQEFEEQASVNDLLYIYIYAFKEQTPSLVRLAVTITDSYERLTNGTRKDKTRRSDIIGFESILLLGNNIDEISPEGRDRFDKRLSIFLGESYNIAVIDEALQGLEYEKTMDGNKTIYSVQDGVIETLVATPTQIVITISDDKLVDYYRTSPRNPD